MTRSFVIGFALLSLVCAPLTVSAQAAPEAQGQVTPEAQAAPEAQAPEPQVAPEAVPPANPPVGPATAMGQMADEVSAREQEDSQERAEAALPEDHMRQALSGETPEIASASPSAEVAVGAIRVAVVDVNGEPMSGVSVDLGIMSQENSRDQVRQTTDEAGLTTFEGLPTGQAQAYRVNVLADGARYSSNPFRLPMDRGYQVSIVNIPTTRSADAVLIMLHHTFLELRAERLHVVQQLQLVNLARETYVFPAGGHEVALPTGYTAFQFQEVMSDQHFTETADGFSLEGSLPPGRTDLLYGYDLPLSGTEMDFTIPVEFRTFSVRVEAVASPDMRLDVEGMPAAEVQERNGQRYLTTEMQRAPTDPNLDELVIHVGGIEGPGPGRWIAVGAASVLFLMGLLFAYRGGSADPARAMRARALHKKELLNQAAELERMFEDNEVGPKYRKRQMDVITTRLATVLREEKTEQAARSRKS